MKRERYYLRGYNQLKTDLEYILFYSVYIIWSSIFKEDISLKKHATLPFPPAKSCPHVCPRYYADWQHCTCTRDSVIECSVSKARKRLEDLVGSGSWARKMYSTDQKIKPRVNTGSVVLIIFKLKYLSVSFLLRLSLASSLLQ